MKIDPSRPTNPFNPAEVPQKQSVPLDTFVAAKALVDPVPLLGEHRAGSIKGHALGMHTWGAERPIDPESGSIRFFRTTHDGESKLSVNFAVGGPVNQVEHLGRRGYACLGHFHDLPLSSLDQLSSGEKISSGATTLSVTDKTLTFTNTQDVFSSDSRAPSFSDRSKLELLLSDDRKQIVSARYIVDREHQSFLRRLLNLFTGAGSTERVTDLTLTNLQR